ncbi:MAG: hypothetical protein ACLPT6_06140 [Desulfobaccales bacterium]
MTDIPNELTDEFYAALGRVVARWSYVEHFIDLCVAVIYQNYDCKHIAHKQQIPTSMKPKLTFLKNALNEPSLMPFRNDGLALISRVYPLKEIRDKMVHSVFSEINLKSYEFIKFNYTKEMHNPYKLLFTLSDYLEVERKLTQLAVDLTFYCDRLVNPLLPPGLFPQL